MKVHVLGSGAGGGFPQWNCNCTNCARFRRGELLAHARTQSSITVSANGIDWVLINASPDIREQIAAFPPLQPGRTLRDTGIRAVVLMDSQIDHTTGLLSLREGDTLELFCTDRVYEDLTTGFPVLDMLGHYCGVHWHPIPIDGESFTLPSIEGLVFTAVSLSSKAPPYSPHRQDPQAGDNIGLRIEDPVSARQLFYAPGLGQMEDHLLPYMENSDCLLIDGTLWTDDEMQKRGVGHKLGSAMGHLSQADPGGIIDLLRPLHRPRKVLIHINNTNPILDENSTERAQLKKEGIEVAHDGMDILL